MLEFLEENGFVLGMWIALFIAVILGLRSKYSAQVKQGLLYLVTEAERQYGGGTGKLKYAAVSNWVYEKLPAFARLFLSAKAIDVMIENAVTSMKDLLKANSSVAAVVEAPLQSTTTIQTIGISAPSNMTREEVLRKVTNRIADTEGK